MKKFKTLTELDILHSAYFHILSKWAKEDEHHQRLANENLATDISEHRLQRYKSQLDELHAEILRLEKGE